MKLLMCLECQDVRKLNTHHDVICDCGKSQGRYLSDGLYAEFSGKNAIMIGFSNPSLVDAVRNQPEEGLGSRFLAFIIPKKAPHIKKLSGAKS